MTLERHLQIESSHQDVPEQFIENTVKAEWKRKCVLHDIEWNVHEDCRKLLESGCSMWIHDHGEGHFKPVMAAMRDSSCALGAKLVAVWTLIVGAEVTGVMVLDLFRQEVGNLFCLSFHGLGPKKASHL